VYSALTNPNLLMNPTLTAFAQAARFSSNNLPYTLNAQAQNCLTIYFNLSIAQGSPAFADVYLIGMGLT
jgi:hypothetical protein